MKKIIRQVLVTFYSDGSSRFSEITRVVPKRDAAGRHNRYLRPFGALFHYGRRQEVDRELREPRRMDGETGRRRKKQSVGLKRGGIDPGADSNDVERVDYHTYKREIHHKLWLMTSCDFL